jgi:hypothetical protein
MLYFLGISKEYFVYNILNLFEESSSSSSLNERNWY